MKKLLCMAMALLSLTSFADDMKGKLSITPIVGLERVQKFQPTPYMKTRVIYGARLVYKFPISALEVEYTHAQDTNNDVASNTSYKDSEDKLRLGLRGEGALTSFSSVYLRGGAQCRKNEQTKTVGSAASTTSNSSKVQPYVGTGLTIHVSQFFALTAEILATYTPTDKPNLKDYELQPTLGINVRF
ncbi:MAG: outer membrane beta-barrel protein [Bacteriovorax sp.]|nr:outer membrane beta-barrel protein [Bacteriovorax sp.]